MTGLSNDNDKTKRSKLPIVIVHGGAWKIPDGLVQASAAGVKRAALSARATLSRGEGAERAVEEAVRVLEDEEVFDAGRGSCLTSAGTVEMDAAMMSARPNGGPTRLGGVACVSRARHPVSVAANVLREGRHVLYVGAGADAYVDKHAHELEVVESMDELVTDAMREELEAFRGTYGPVVSTLFNGHDTVGCVVVDADGTIACATSTGGITAKHIGRVGDSPLSGSGLYCESGVAGVSSTGHGESISKAVLCKHVVDRMQMAADPVDTAVTRALGHMKKVSGGGCGGIIAADGNGKYAAECTTERMAWACVTSEGVIRGGIERGEDKVLGYI